MQVFVIGSPLEAAKVLDKKRLNKQVIECKQILNAIEGKTKAWTNHPCTMQYRCYKRWLYGYSACLAAYLKYINGDICSIGVAYIFSELCNRMTPNFHTEEYFENMKKRLYTKNHEHYKQWESLGESYENWYWVDNKWKIYKQE